MPGTPRRSASSPGSSRAPLTRLLALGELALLGRHLDEGHGLTRTLALLAAPRPPLAFARINPARLPLAAPHIAVERKDVLQVLDDRQLGLEQTSEGHHHVAIKTVADEELNRLL